MITSAQINLLIGKTVEMICFAQYSVYLHLEGRVTLTIESEFESGLVDAERIQRAKFPIRQSSLTRIVESLVTTAELNKDGNLRLLFSTGDSLQVLTQPPFESYRLRIGGKEFYCLAGRNPCLYGLWCLFCFAFPQEPNSAKLAVF